MGKRRARVEPKLQQARSQAGHGGWLREYFVTIVTCVIIALFVTTFVAHPMSVPTPSMVPTILVGDRLIVDKFTLRSGDGLLHKILLARRIGRGDIVVFKYPKDPTIPYVKRVIGMPGEVLEIKNGQVYINQRELDEAYVYHSDVNTGSEGISLRDNFGPVAIPAGHYFVMGDNRDNSEDSRYWGFVPEKYIIGRPLFVFWSYEDEPYRPLTTVEVAKLYLDRAVHFFTKTRWRRMGKVIR